MTIDSTPTDTLDQRQLLRVLTAFKRGDFTVRMPDDRTGLAGKIADTLNDVIEMNQQMTGEIERVSIAVGRQGRITQRAAIPHAAGSWAASVNSVNSLIGDLVQPTTEVARVIGAVAKGDLSQTMALEVEGRPLQGEFLRTAKVANTMVAQLGLFASEVTRVAREVGADGKLGGQAKVKGVAGTWKDLTDNVNSMASNLTAQVRNIAEVTTAVANGDLSKKITVDVKGEILELKNTINTMVDQLRSFASEVTRVAKEVGTEGKLGGQAEVKGVAGTWKDLTDNVNSMASNLTAQVRNIAAVTTAVANGDLSTKITVDVRGEILELKNTINTMVDQLGSFASEVTRVAREVGTEGNLGGQAQVKGVAGTWKDLTDNVNSMASNLTAQVRNIAAVTTAVANGDLSKKITVDVQGEILELKNTINTMVDQLGSFASEVTRVAREVGTEGNLGGQAQVKGVAGTWKDLTDNVNSMASNLTAQVRNIAAVTTAVANGDLSTKITVDVRGEILELKNTINTMVDQLGSFASEVTRVAREVGTEGKLGGQAQVKGVAGTWKDLTDNVNSMAGNLTAQVRNIAAVTTAVANGDLSKKITVDVQGEILELKNTINTMVDQLGSFASEVTRVAREVGTEGNLGGQAQVKGVAGTWKDLTDNVNSMASNLTTQVRNIAAVTTAVANGDLSKKITVDVRGEILELKNTINTMVDQLGSFASEVTRVAREVGTEGKLGGQAQVKGVAGTWKDLTDNVNSMASNLTTQVRNIAEVTTAVANGDLSKQITVDVRGEILELKNTINTMVDQLGSFASEVTRVAREVGTEGKLGGQAVVKGVAGTWKDLTDNVNSMASNLTTQVRSIARVVTAVANGDLKRKLVLEAKGEIAALADTINSMIDTLATFADQVTNVAREVGTEGKLGGQASVPGAAGIWRALTDNVNQLTATLTTQVRAIAEVATAVTKGDLTRSITVQAQGEVAALKDNINEMIRNLRETTRKNTEQDWLKTNLAKFTRMLQGERDLLTVSKRILSELAPLVHAQHGVFCVTEPAGDHTVLRLLAAYAYKERKSLSNIFKLGEGLVGQCALEKERIVVTEVPDDYITINSGLGEATPKNIVVLPVIFEGNVKAVIELASFNRYSEIILTFLDQLTESIGIVLNTISANMRTEEFLKQSQALTEELQSQQGELTNTNRRLEEQARTLRASEERLKEQQEKLKQTNEELEEKARLLEEQKNEVERKNQEVEQAKRMFEDKAEQLALTSRYKSEFLANMSHELRTPLNSMLILSKLLADNTEDNLTAQHIEFARTIHASGTELLELINDILDLSKIESGTMTVEVEEVRFGDIYDQVERSFRQIAQSKALDFTITIGTDVPHAMLTDPKRLQQVLKNLLSNAFKFTDRGSVQLRVDVDSAGWTAGHPMLSAAEKVIGFTVSDTGIGIPPEKHQIIFEAFQQADGTTSRRFGGTGLGLYISRKIARLLGGEIQLQSNAGVGSTFTLFLPLTYVPLPVADGNGAARSRPFAAAGDLQPQAGDLQPQPTDVRPAQETSVQGPVMHLPGSELAPVSDASPMITHGDRVLLIIDDDPSFGKILAHMAHERGFGALVAHNGEAGISLARRSRPDAIVLDLRLPDVEGWKVLQELKNDPQTQHIPVYVISVVEGGRKRALRDGAVAYLNKPEDAGGLIKAIEQLREFIEKTVHRLLIVESDATFRQSIVDLISHGDISVTCAETGTQALSMLMAEAFDCVIVGVGLADMSGFDLIDKIQEIPGRADLPMIVSSARSLSGSELGELRRVVETAIVKDGRSPDQLLAALVLFLHRPEAGLSDSKRRMLQRAWGGHSMRTGQRILVVDDDARNILAIASTLERQGMVVLRAGNGRDALAILEHEPDIDAIVMDIMMPEMDGYETMQRIRQNPRFRTLPIVALTAKAMKEDREKCIAAGASGYITKPVDPDDLVAILQGWLRSGVARS